MDNELELVEREGMPAVYQLRPNNAVLGLKKLLELAEAGELDNFVLAAFDKNDMVILARANVNVVEQQHLASYIQVDTTVRTITECNQIAK